MKVGVLNVGYNSFDAQRAAPGFQFPPQCRSSHQGWGSWRACVSAFPTHFDVVFLLFAQCEGVTPPVFRGVFVLFCFFQRELFHR